MASHASCKDVVKEKGTSKVHDYPPSSQTIEEEITNPCSGRYVGGQRGFSLEMMVDIDKIRRFSPSLGVISGNLSSKDPSQAPWSGGAACVYFTSISRTLKVSGTDTLQRDVTADLKVTFSDGKRTGGRLVAQFTLPQDVGTWRARVEVEILGNEKIRIESVERESLFFRDVKLDIDFTEKVIWPIVELYNLDSQPAGMSDRKIDAFSAFEDAGLKLHYDEAHSEKIEDPTPNNPWTKGDLFDVMENYFDEIENSHENVWCMMGETPPDKRYMGFSFDKNGRTGFGLFTGHKCFAGLDSDNPRKKAFASRRLLHYLVHECGHCLGLKHPFEIGAPNSLSWMNYAWKYDVTHEPGSFYREFKYSFSDKELMILRHTPGKEFRACCDSSALCLIMGSEFKMKSEVPDAKLADDDSDDDDEADDADDVGIGAAKRGKFAKARPMRKIALDLKFRPEPFVKGQIISFEARITNLGKLPALIEGDLSLESGNLQLFMTSPDGSVQTIDPFVRPIQSGFTKPFVLYTPEDTEGADRYSQLVIVGEGSDGYQFTTAGEYSVRAVYSGGRFRVTSRSYRITIEDEEDHDTEAASQVASAATLTSGSSRFKKTQEYWKKLVTKAVDYKRKRIAEIAALMECLSIESKREPVYSSGKRLRRGRRKKALAVSKVQAAHTPKHLLKETDDILKYFQEQGTAADNLDYSRFVFVRGGLHIAAKQTDLGDIEFNRMLADLIMRGEEHDVLQSVSKKWNKMKNPVKPEDKTTPEYLQKKVDAVLTWAPSVDGNGEPDLSGVGLGRPFSNFQLDQLAMASKVVEMLFNKYDDTKELTAVIGYADKLQKGREVNYMVLRWALEAFIVHSMDAKRAGIKYPEPADRDQSMASDAAMVVTRRVGTPTEDWMAYWRCDGDFNYHHRHFHMVYVVSQFLRRDQHGNPIILDSAPDHLERQGELFGYMHTQLLARYDADRESWGLSPVQPWSYTEQTMTFNAGLEFHSDPQFRRYAPRPSIKWPAGAVRQFQEWENAYNKAVETRVINTGLELTPNRAGHILEPSSGMYRNPYGSYHNAGHGIFGSTGLPPGATSYMNDTATAVRDTIFYRWHKQIDNLWQSNNEHYKSEIGLDAPPVTITADDIIINSDMKPPTGFDKFGYGNWANGAPQEPSIIKTYLGPPVKKYEWDNKLSHEGFFYHLRLKRNQGSKIDTKLNLTIRIFICPKNRVAERIKWIEMDKFVYCIPANVDHAVVTRADVHSSVIKRLPRHAEGDIERKYVKDAGGFCECGWPYSMLLPRGTSNGQQYVICVIATDNNIDNIGIRTTCGSMSYCGARGEKYPDSRIMGYPFSGPIAVNGTKHAIPEVFDQVTNAAYKDFIIKNNVSEPPPVPAVDIWWPHYQLKVNDGTLRREPPSGVTEFIQSNLVGTFRVLLDNDGMYPPMKDLIMIRFQGRGPRGGAYVIRDIKLAIRHWSSLNVNLQGPWAYVTYKNQARFSVPEEGLISDPIQMNFHPGYGDYFLTFTLDSPGVYLPASQNTFTSTYFIKGGDYYGPIPDDWTGIESKITGRYPHIHCVSGIMTAM